RSKSGCSCNSPGLPGGFGRDVVIWGADAAFLRIEREFAVLCDKVRFSSGVFSGRSVLTLNSARVEDPLLMPGRLWRFVNPHRLWRLLLGFALTLAIAPAGAEDLQAGKSASAIFATDCSGCHRGPRGLAKTMTSRTALSSFLREHYTTGSGPASELASYILGMTSEERRAPKPAASGEPPARQTLDRP